MRFTVMSASKEVGCPVCADKVGLCIHNYPKIDFIQNCRTPVLQPITRVKNSTFKIWRSEINTGLPWTLARTFSACSLWTDVKPEPVT
ncbi:UNVERIFIED_CONTAM: hypothetical protein PYX00_007232 [Menopon gallinae]|uniref:Uncharacterized protein n=1 Tax=Menopon gallinae TaxID=328185 RepID=A0AAW2HIE8_9NEOP